MITEFKLHGDEVNKAEEFKKKHIHSDIYTGAIGGHIEYNFLPTSVGTAVSIRCSLCGEEENITDYNCW